MDETNTDDRTDAGPSSSILMEIIRAQTEIARLGLDLGGVIDFVAEQVRRLTGADGAIVELADRTEMVYRAAAGMTASQLGLRLERSGSLSGISIEQGAIVYCRDCETDTRVDVEASRRVGIGSLVCAPLDHAGTAVGVLKIASAAPNAFGSAHIRILELMSGVIAAAMYHAVRYETGELYHRATHDALTGLPNRALFFDRLRQCLARASRHTARIAVLTLELDGLEPINDALGRRAGDAALRIVATRLAEGSRDDDTVARLSGTEFEIILTDLPDRDGAVSLARRIDAEIAEPFDFEGRSVQLGVRIGLAVFPEDGTEIEALVDRADAALSATRQIGETNG